MSATSITRFAKGIWPRPRQAAPSIYQPGPNYRKKFTRPPLARRRIGTKRAIPFRDREAETKNRSDGSRRSLDVENGVGRSYVKSTTNVPYIGACVKHLANSTSYGIISQQYITTHSRCELFVCGSVNNQRYVRLPISARRTLLW